MLVGSGNKSQIVGCFVCIILTTLGPDLHSFI